MPGDEIHLTQKQLDAAHSNGTTPSRLIRNLMGVFFDPATLAVSSACGTRNNKALDKDIVETCICKLHKLHNIYDIKYGTFQIMCNQSSKTRQEVI